MAYGGGTVPARSVRAFWVTSPGRTHGGRRAALPRRRPGGRDTVMGTRRGVRTVTVRTLLTETGSGCISMRGMNLRSASGAVLALLGGDTSFGRPSRAASRVVTSGSSDPRSNSGNNGRKSLLRRPLTNSLLLLLERDNTLMYRRASDYARHTERETHTTTKEEGVDFATPTIPNRISRQPESELGLASPLASEGNLTECG